MTPRLDLVVRARRTVGTTGEAARAVGVHDGTIVTVQPFDGELAADREVVLSDDEVLLPGLVDSHVHVNEPGRTEWEGFASATRAAAAGGVTTVVDMPLNSIPPTVDVSALEQKRRAAQPQIYVDVAFWGGAVPGNADDLARLHEAGVVGFKCFLVDSGTDEFPPLDAAGLERAMQEIAGFGGLLIVHAEDARRIAAAEPGPSYRTYLESRPPAAECVAVARVVDAAHRTGCRVHVVHVSSAEVVPKLRRARQEGVRVTAETCPHYLLFGAEDVADGRTDFKCCPPIRESPNRELLWDALRDGTLTSIVSDHSPSVPALKLPDTGDFANAWGGIASLQLGLSAVWTEARRRGFDLVDVARWMSRGPAFLCGLPRKGRIAVGYDADFCVFEPDTSFVVDPDELHHRNPTTPYAGRTLDGRVRRSWLRGGPVEVEAGPRGRLIDRGAE